MTWREYHESTRHLVDSLKGVPVLDWANMPDSFRHYEGAPILDLPADPPVPGISALEVLRGAAGTTPARDGPALLSQLLYHSAAVSASKLVPATGYKYALRVNPSSGNLHPTEFHFITRGLQDWPDGLYHYRPSAHTAEQRALGGIELKLGAASAPITFILTSIAWREAWKYGDRAYRYCLHDIGHAWQALTLAARAIGCDSLTAGYFPDDEVASFCRFHEDEWPMLVIQVRGKSIPVRVPDAGTAVWQRGKPNPISKKTIGNTLIDGIHRVTKLSLRACRGIASAAPDPAGSGEIKLSFPASSTRAFGDAARKRRSALNFVGGEQAMSRAQLSAILGTVNRPFLADFTNAHFIQLYLYAHRVEGLEPGVYRFWPVTGELEQIRSGDQQLPAAALSLGQDLAGNACLAFSMIGDLERAARAHGDRGYRYVHFEAGAIGHRLYLAAESLGLGATGIGAFYDEEVRRYLNLAPGQGEVVYHFAIGYPIPDPRPVPEP